MHLAQSIFGPCMYIPCWPKYSAFGPKHSWLTHCNLIAPCRFKRCFISLGPMLNIAYGCGMRFAAVDAAFSKHTVYRDGQLHLLTTRDGDNKTIVLAWAICETESKATYEYFATKCHEVPRGRCDQIPFGRCNHLQRPPKRHQTFPRQVSIQDWQMLQTYH